MIKKDTVSLQLWLPTGIYEKVMNDPRNSGTGQCERFRTILLAALTRHLAQSELPIQITSEIDRRPMAIPITINRADYDALSEMAQNTGLSKKKLAEVLICEEVL